MGLIKRPKSNISAREQRTDIDIHRRAGSISLSALQEYS